MDKFVRSSPASKGLVISIIAGYGRDYSYGHVLRSAKMLGLLRYLLRPARASSAASLVVSQLKFCVFSPCTGRGKNLDKNFLMQKEGELQANIQSILGKKAVSSLTLFNKVSDVVSYAKPIENHLMILDCREAAEAIVKAVYERPKEAVSKISGKVLCIVFDSRAHGFVHPLQAPAYRIDSLPQLRPMKVNWMALHYTLAKVRTKKPSSLEKKISLLLAKTKTSPALATIRKILRQRKRFVFLYTGNIQKSKYLAKAVHALNVSSGYLANVKEKAYVECLVVCGAEEGGKLENKLRGLWSSETSQQHDRASQLSILGGCSEELFEVLRAAAELFITHFGRAALRRASEEKALLLLHPSGYHHALAKEHIGGYYEVPELAAALASSGRLGGSLRKSWLGSRVQVNRQDPSLASFMYEVAKAFPQIRNSCPLCASGLVQPIFRHRAYTLMLCWSCRSIFKNRFCSPQFFHSKNMSYKKEYFLKEYKQQYGRSYLEDRGPLKALAERRLERIETLLEEPGAWLQRDKDKVLRKAARKVLDIGCAYGFFLDVAKQGSASASGSGRASLKRRGRLWGWGKPWKTMGLEISKHAHAHAAKNHKVLLGDAYVSLGKLKRSHKNLFTAITMWYVFEHIENIEAFVARVLPLLKEGGILGLAVPNAYGLSARFSKERFYSHSPEDHAFIFSKRGLEVFFESHQLQLVSYACTGIHHNRALGLAGWKNFFLRNLARLVGEKGYKKIARAWNLGDTMELYFRKTKAAS